MMTRLTPLLALALLACSGGPGSLTLTPDARDIAADGLTVVELEAGVVFRGDPISDGKDVTFTCSQALLFETRDDVLADVPGGRKPGEQEVEIDSSGGVARAYLLAPLSAGEITVQASFTTVNKDVLSDSITFDVAPPPLIAAGKGDRTNFVSHFDFTCEQKNVGGFVQNRDPIEVTCTLTLKDVTGRDLPHTPVMFFAEAGHIRDQPATDRSARTITYVIPTAPPQMPRDVDPQPLEETKGLVEFTDDPNYTEYNPTDGLVTLLAVVRGQESFDDRNGNGEIDTDPEEEWIDEGEPFLDVNDDGEFNGSTDPEPCCDSNGNGTVDGLNGRWDADVWIGRMTHILWTGTADVSVAHSYIVPAEPWSMDAQGNESFTLRIVDQKFNPLATNDVDDNLQLVPSSNLTLAPQTLVDGVTLEPTTGMYLNNVFPAFIFGTGDAITNPVFDGFRMNGSLLAGREWEFTLFDDRSTSRMCDQAADTGNVTATLEYSIARDVSHREGVVSSLGNLADLAPTHALCQ